MDHDLSRRHWRVGWTALAFFVAGGLVLEALHGLKVASYLDGEHGLRRELWTLAHAHGGLIAIVNLVFATFLGRTARPWPGAEFVSRLLLVALVLIPLGFGLGGIDPIATDPGIGIWLVPPGGLALLTAVVALAVRAWRAP